MSPPDGGRGGESPRDDGPRGGADADESEKERHSLGDLVELLERDRPLSPPAEADPDPSLWLDPTIDSAEAGPDDESGPADRPGESETRERESDIDLTDRIAGASDATDAVSAATRSGDGRPTLRALADRVSRQSPARPGGSEGPDAPDGAASADRAADSGGRSATPSRARSRETALDLVADDPNVLLCGPGSCTADQHLCTELLAPAAAEDVNLLLVTFDQSAAERLAVVAGDLGRVPERTAVVSLGGSDRAGSTVSAPGSDVAVPVKTVSNPSDLMKLGFAITKYLSEWESSPGRTLVCFHSLSDALRAADPKLVLRFLHVLQHQIGAAGARAHYHLDPDAHSSELVLTFTPLFETVLDFDRDGSVSIER